MLYFLQHAKGTLVVKQLGIRSHSTILVVRLNGVFSVGALVVPMEPK